MVATRLIATPNHQVKALLTPQHWMLGSVFGSFLLSMVYCGQFPSLTMLGSSFWLPPSAMIPSSPFPLTWSLQTVHGLLWMVSSPYCLWYIAGSVFQISSWNCLGGFITGNADHGSSPLPSVEHCGVSLYLLLPPRLPCWDHCPSCLYRRRCSSLFPTHSPISLQTALSLLCIVSLPLCSWYIADSAL